MTHVLRLSRQDDPGYGDQVALARTLSAVTGACRAIRNSLFHGYPAIRTPGDELLLGQYAFAAAAPGLPRSTQVAVLRGTWEACSKTVAQVSQSKMLFR
jgi:hypothetical protein